MEGKRPGGLTALAVFNFIFGGLGLLGSLTLLALPALLDQVTQAPNMNEQQRAQLDALQQIGTLPLWLTSASGVIVGALLIASGIGYLKQKKFLGRTLGNVYALFSILSAVPIAFLMPVALGGGFNLTSILSFLYPALTLLLLNTTFKEDFVN
jgi:hypothetical protein